MGCSGGSIDVVLVLRKVVCRLQWGGKCVEGHMRGIILYGLSGPSVVS